jgi:hypothetical protein
MSQWITLEEARANAQSNIAWWKCEDPNGQHVKETQYDPKGPIDKPVYLYEHGDMYLGEWEKYGNKSRPAGFGVYLSQGECVFVGLWRKGKLNGSCKMLWMPSSPLWTENRDWESPIKVKTADVPFLYIGHYKNDLKNDPFAKVILKDGTTRVGPWRDDVPVGDWWKKHKQRTKTSPEQMARLLSFGGTGVAHRRSEKPISDNVVVKAAERKHRIGPTDQEGAGVAERHSKPNMNSEAVKEAEKKHRVVPAGQAGAGVADRHSKPNMNSEAVKEAERKHRVVPSGQAGTGVADRHSKPKEPQVTTTKKTSHVASPQEVNKERRKSMGIPKEKGQHHKYPRRRQSQNPKGDRYPSRALERDLSTIASGAQFIATLPLKTTSRKVPIKERPNSRKTSKNSTEILGRRLIL